MNDTGLNKSESLETLLHQQARLIARKRAVQMFPKGSKELPLPAGMMRCSNERGVFHYNPALISAVDVLRISGLGQENLFLELGPHSKSDILNRIKHGEQFVALYEATPDGMEVRCAAGTTGTLVGQIAYFERTKEPANHIEIGLPPRVMHG